MTIEEEIAELGELGHLGMALLQFSRSLTPGQFTKQGDIWIYSPNFVSLELRFKRVQRLNVLVHPTKVPREVERVLFLFAGPKSYGRIEVTEARQLAAACTYIEGNWLKWHRGKYRTDPWPLVSTKEPNKAPEPTPTAAT